MTAIIGVLCRDGIVVATDSAATFGIGTGNNVIRTIETLTKKITIVDSRFIIAGTGEIGLNQRFCHFVKSFSDQKKFAAGKNSIEASTELAHAVLSNFASTGVTAPNVQLGCLLAFPIGESLHLCEFQFLTLQPEFKNKDIWFVSMGSGQQITDSFLAFLARIFCPKANAPPSLSDGIFMATWALSHAIEFNAGGIQGPIQLATLTKGPKGIEARLYTDEDIEEHKASIIAAEEHLRDYQKSLLSGVGKGVKIPDLGKSD